MSQVMAKVGTFALIGTLLTGCSKEFIAEVTKARELPPEIKRVDDNHYVLHPRNTDGVPGISTEEFAASLAKFRQEVPGDFMMVPKYLKDPLYYTDRYPEDAPLMVRRTAVYPESTNTIALEISPGDSKEE